MKLFRNGILMFLVIALLTNPVFASADSKGKNKNKQEEKIEKREEKKNKKSEKKDDDKCIYAWGKLIAYGWFKNNPSVNVDLDNCDFPFGIGKKLNRASTTVDTVAPIISNTSVFTGINKAIVYWETNEKTSGKIYYSTSSPVNISTAQTIKSNSNFGDKNHFVAMSNLASSTTYYLIIEAKDKAGNIKRANEITFVTKSSPVSLPTDTTAPNITSINTISGTSTISVFWNTNENSISKVYYATSTPISTSTTNFVYNNTFSTNHNLKIENLATSTTYYLMIEARDSSLNTSTSTTFTSTTLSQ